jgi:negative regulator of sigma E activity
MNCERTREQLTAYLDGELEGDDGTPVRGHLRTCEACRAIATDEAALRDGLRALPPVDPPASLWAGVQARLAAEEVRESERPAWRRALAKWGRMIPAPRYVAIGGLAVAATIAFVIWKTHDSEPAPIADNDGVQRPVHDNNVKIAPEHTAPKPVPTMCKTISDSDDVTLDLAQDSAREQNAYECAIQDLMTKVTPVRAQWNDRDRSLFDENIKTMREAIAKADGRAKAKASRALVRYLQNAANRDDVVAIAGVP